MVTCCNILCILANLLPKIIHLSLNAFKYKLEKVHPHVLRNHETAIGWRSKKVRLYSKVGTRISKSIDLAEISATNEPSYTKFYYPLCYFLPSITSFANYKICHSTTILLTGHELLSFYVALSKYTNILSFFHASEVIQVILIHLVSSDGWTG